MSVQSTISVNRIVVKVYMKNEGNVNSLYDE